MHTSLIYRLSYSGPHRVECQPGLLSSRPDDWIENLTLCILCPCMPRGNSNIAIDSLPTLQISVGIVALFEKIYDGEPILTGF